MNYIVVEKFAGETQAFIGPFPSQCQAMTYSELLAKDDMSGCTYEVRQIQTPAHMPVRIHA